MVVRDVPKIDAGMIGVFLGKVMVLVRSMNHTCIQRRTMLYIRFFLVLG